jgi:hypothetical protein
MNILYNTVYSDPLKNSCMLTVIDDGYQVDGYHLSVSDGYITFASKTYFMPATEIVIPLPFPSMVKGYFCLDVHNNNLPCILVDEINAPSTGYNFADGNYKFIDTFFKASSINLNNQTIKFLRIVQRGA